MAFINQDRKSSIQSDRLNLKQTPADIWEYDDANTDSTPTLSLKSPWKFSGEFRPPIGIPTFWFTSVIPDWALDCTDGATGYEFADYPELDNSHFKQFLADFTTFGSADNTTTFNMPDIKGLFSRLAGTNGGKGTYYAGGVVGSFIAQQLLSHNHALTMGYTDSDQGNFGGGRNAYGTQYTGSTGGTENRPGSFSISLIVRFE